MQSSSSRSIWRNDGHGILSIGQNLGMLGPIKMRDLDGDRDLDAYSVNDGADKVWLNQGYPTFAISVQSLGSTTRTDQPDFHQCK
jgi:hypothetical protein